MKIVPAVSLFFLPLLIASCTAVEYGMNDSMPPPSAVVETAADADGWAAADSAPAAPAAGYSGSLPEGNRFEQQKGRRMTYTAELSLQVDNLPDVLRKAEELVKAAGGYVQESGDNGGILRIPVEKADEVLRKIEAFGTVGSRRIVGTDVTDTVVDAEIRLNNLKTLRTRLLALLEKSDKVEDTLKIEQELNRVVTEIERYEGRLALLNNRISYVTLTLRLNQSAPVVFVPKLPVPWVASVGETGKLPSPNGRKNMPFNLDLPENFAILASSRFGDTEQLYAVTADDCVLRLTRRPNLEGASLEFWRTLARRSLTEVNRYRTASETSVTMDGGDEAACFEGFRGNAGYLLYVVRPRRTFCHIPFGHRVCLIEFWGPEEAYRKHLDAVRKAAMTFEL